MRNDAAVERQRSSAQFDRYLRLLEIDGRPRGLVGLQQIVANHIERIPFENVSKLLLWKRNHVARPTTVPEFLDGIEHYDLGGTCYTNNPFLKELLRYLGYDADLLGADMSTPNVHTCIRVRLDGREYHIDTGYGGPFREPIALDNLPHTFTQGKIRFVFAPQGNHRIALTVFESTPEGERVVHGYRVNETPRELSFFEPVILQSFEPGRTFMANVRIARFLPGATLELRNRFVVRIEGERYTKQVLSSVDELEDVVHRDFDMPRCPVREAVGILEQNLGIPFSRWPEFQE